MAQSASNSGELEVRETWDSYSDFQQVSQDVAKAISRAVDSYGVIYGRHAENADIDPQAAAAARGKIIGAAFRVRTEMEIEKENNDVLADMLDDWTGEEGYFSKFDEVQLQYECPNWMDDWIRDIRRAGWELGYLRAGQYEREEIGDEVETDARSMFDSL